MAPQRPAKQVLPDDYAAQQSPWVDFSLTSFWMDERVGNFLNLGTQVGGYFVGRLRLTARVVVPLESVDDDFATYNSHLNLANGEFRPVDSQNMSVLYAGSVGVILSSAKTFVFAPSILVQRTDVNDYGTSVALALPFEWTTPRHLRIGFELALGRAFGGSVTRPCYASDGTSCGRDDIDRPTGTSILFQYYMGWSLGHL